MTSTLRPYLVHHLFEDAAERVPDNLVMEEGDLGLTFREVNERASALARALGEAGVGPGERVGVLHRKGPDFIVGVWGALKAGAVCVPLDVAAPPSYLAGIVDACSMAGILRVRASDGEELVPGTFNTALERTTPSGPPPVLSGLPPTDLDLAFVMFTSGSTGRPKGVRYPHRSVVGAARYQSPLYAPNARTSSQAPAHFAAFPLSMAIQAATGSTEIVLPPEFALFPAEIARFVREKRLTNWSGVGSAIATLASRTELDGEEFPDLRMIVLYGEPVPPETLTRFMRLFPHVTFANAFGATEFPCGTLYFIPPTAVDQADPIRIARATDNAQSFVLTDDGSVAQPGEQGEVYFRSSYLADGYWDDPEGTAAAFVANPLTGDQRDIVYRTGDIVAVLDDGNYLYVGRRDDRVKTRGFRVELGAVEHTLSLHPAVIECAVVSMDDADQGQRLEAFVAVTGEVDARELRQWCGRQLPRSHVPAAFHFRDRLPRTSTGKVDRRTLEGRSGG